MNYRHVIVSGGEPTIQKDFDEFIVALLKKKLHVTVETNGTKAPGESIARILRREMNEEFGPLLYSISLKLSSSTPPEAIAGDWSKRHEETRLNLSELKRIFHYGQVYPRDKFDYYFKFVASTPTDEHEIVTTLEKIAPLEFFNDRIFVMPEGCTKDEQEHTKMRTYELALKRGWRYTSRLHIEMFGAKRLT